MWAIYPPAEESGISRPSDGVHRRSPIGATYDAFGSERYILTFDNQPLRDVAALAPYEFVEILTNSQTYGGGGIFSQYGTVAADSLWTPYVFVHEFGHHFADSPTSTSRRDVAYAPAAERLEPWEPNVTALLDPRPQVERPRRTRNAAARRRGRRRSSRMTSARSRRSAARSAPPNGPEDQMEALFNEELDTRRSCLAATARRAVGAFEGAIYEAQGLLPAAGGLHHVHSRRGALLRRLPPRDRARHRVVRAARQPLEPVEYT